MKDQSKIVVRILGIASAISFIIAIALIVLLRLLQVDSISQWYGKYTNTLMRFEQSIENMDQLWLTAIVIELNFILKAIVPWLPISVLCFVTGVIFKWYIAIPLNLIGLTMLFTIKYFWGRRFGGGNAEKILSKYDKFYNIVIDEDKIGSPLVLFVSRLIPCWPINLTSQIYGSLKFDYWKYLLISLIGFSYKLFSYTLIGRNVYDPLSLKFILPLIPLFLISSIVLLILNGALTVTITARNRIKLSKTKK